MFAQVTISIFKYPTFLKNLKGKILSFSSSSSMVEGVKVLSKEHLSSANSHFHSFVLHFFPKDHLSSTNSHFLSLTFHFFLFHKPMIEIESKKYLILVVI